MTSILMTEFVSPAPQSHLTIIMCANISYCSYFIVRRGNVSVPDMYWFHGIYRYQPKIATNWRAVAAFFIGCVPPLPGFVNNIIVAGNGNPTPVVSIGGQHL